MSTEERVKVNFPLEGNYIEELYKNEIVWARPRGNFYEIDNIPFYIRGIALGDTISITKKDSINYFKQLEVESGNSTIRVLFYKLEFINVVIKHLEDNGCSWEGSNVKNLYAVNVPLKVNYAALADYLAGFVNQNILECEEGCIAQ